MGDPPSADEGEIELGGRRHHPPGGGYGEDSAAAASSEINATMISAGFPGAIVPLMHPSIAGLACQPPMYRFEPDGEEPRGDRPRSVVIPVSRYRIACAESPKAPARVKGCDALG